MEEYFALYAQGNWEALASYYAPEITQFITLKNAKPTQVTASAKSFFKGKSNIRYTPDMTTCKITQAQMGWDVQVELDMEWDQQKTRVLLKMAFLNPGYKIVFYKEEKVLSKQKRGEMSLEELFKSIPQYEQLTKQGNLKVDAADPRVLRYSFTAKSSTAEVHAKLLNLSNRKVFVMVHTFGGPSSGTEGNMRFSGNVFVRFFEKTPQGWQKPTLLPEVAQKEINGLFKKEDVSSLALPQVRFRSNDFTIVQGSQKMNIAWDNGTYRIVSKEE